MISRIQLAEELLSLSGTTKFCIRFGATLLRPTHIRSPAISSGLANQRRRSYVCASSECQCHRNRNDVCIGSVAHGNRERDSQKTDRKCSRRRSSRIPTPH